MSDFVYLFRSGGAVPSAADRDAQMRKWVAWIKDLEEKGHLKNRGSALRSVGRVVASNKPVTDGPYSEKDLVVGFLIVQSPDIDHAATLSSGCPILDYGGTVEVRPVLEVPG
ncbi:MAG TPA: YciI family protein [Vicinamibacterales bacterium]|nr:YciI family protein [Vicinamibacterales bacterium]